MDTYYIDKYEVTNISYQACVDAEVCDPPQKRSSYTHKSYYGNNQYADYPVVFINWSMAKLYCNWRGARLPTEAEWEKAARGDGRIYPWGNDFMCENGNFMDVRYHNGSVFDAPACDGFNDTAPVGSYKSGISPYGIYDMAGNVMEWVFDWYLDSYYSKTPFENPLGADLEKYRGIRGGSWYDDQDAARSSNRGWAIPTYADGYTGFRCALPPAILQGGGVVDCLYKVRAGDIASLLVQQFGTDLSNLFYKDGGQDNFDTIYTGSVLILNDISPEVCVSGGGKSFASSTIP